MKKYLTIQNIRYKNKFDAVFEVADDVLDKKILKLTLQPLVENCIYHGIENMERKGLIEIHAFQNGSNVIIKVSDNGLGMKEERIQELNSMQIHGEDDNSASIAVKNINKRIKLHFGEEYGLKFVKNDGPGITVIVKIPAIEN